MGTAISRRGFSDASLYVAYNTRSKVTPVTVCIVKLYDILSLLLWPYKFMRRLVRMECYARYGSGMV